MIPKPLPHAGINPIGDCGACCLGALSNKSIREIYDIYGHEQLSYHGIITTIQRLGLEYENFLPNYYMITNQVDWFPFGMPAYQNWMSWFQLSLGRTNRNMVGIAHVNLNGKANLDPYVDHYVLIQVKDMGDGAVNKIVEVRCPTKGDFELPTKDFLLKYGGYNTIWITPKI
jgi:hypothetical protein